MPRVKWYMTMNPRKGGKEVISNQLRDVHSHSLGETAQSLIESPEGIRIMRAFMQILTEKFQKSIRREKIGYEGDLSASINSKAYKNQFSLKGQTRFNYYGRFVDMGVGKGVKLYEAKTGVSLTEGRKSGMTRRRAKKWYGPTLAHQHLKLAEVMAKAQAGELANMTAAKLRNQINIEL